eukprot:TRINITY_DN1049_c0_g1::TRINITY_DN1049_c0_g1_i1::g.30045::m.30045 TRINITY_DN1049_c0_g1::TRINITY_DN1049_c0_g1_i1::g.30045  ORF type:complete len:774 (+),score=262.38,sp/Q63704/CPT1B_RAT/43.24/2e-178,Carn_acyltransf/PF00755.15/2.3e-169 TRINITY_DN1049_c0_g1_i1:107-2428(+)
MKRVASFNREEGLIGGFRGGQVFIEEGHLKRIGGRSIRFYMLMGHKVASHYLTPARLFAIGAAGLYFTLNKQQSDWIFKQLSIFAPQAGSHANIYRFGFLSIAGASVLLESVKWMRQMVLRGLLYSQNWLYNPTSKLSKFTALAVKALSGSAPTTYSFERSLPRLPVPPLELTTQRWLRSMLPLLSEEEKKRMEGLIDEFVKGVGPTLHRIIWLRSLWASNWIEDWWEKYVYLRSESSIMINTNFYGTDLEYRVTMNQASRAASMIWHMLRFKRMIDKEELRPLCLFNVFPNTMVSYERLFSTTRVPGQEEDALVHYDRKVSRHLAVICKGAFYKVPVHHINGCPLSMGDFEKQFQRILRDARENPPSAIEAKVAALTSLPRREWANARESFMSAGVNKQTLDMVESSIFVLVLAEAQPEAYDDRAKLYLHGDGQSYWFDKSFNLVVCANGRAGFNCEHSFADAPIMAHMWEYTLWSELGTESNSDPMETRYKYFDADGVMINRDTSCWKYALQPPLRCAWEINDGMQTAIYDACSKGQLLIDDTQLHIEGFLDYGKGFMKQCKLSPDGFIQAALQLAYFREYGKFALTYESGTTRLFRGGRTETIRALSVESAAFVNAMVDSKSTNAERREKLKKSTEQHVQYSKDAMTGRGVDRLMFGLYVVSVGLGVQTPKFLKEALSFKWTLSTSQTPTRQTTLWAPDATEKYVEFLSPGGGFGPVTDDGYGISYMIVGERAVYFHVSAKRSCPTTDSVKFGNAIRKALLEMKDIFLNK